MDIGQYTAERISESEKQSALAETSLRDTAKWIISGIAVAAAGVIAGASLSSLGSFGFGTRFFVALAAAAIGYVGLGWLFASALAVIAPRDHTLDDIANGRDIPANWPQQIEDKIKNLFLPETITTLKAFAAYANNPVDSEGKPLMGADMVNFNKARRLVGAKARSAERELQFSQLKRRTFAVTPLIALAFIAFSVVANPAKDERVPAMEKFVEVNADDNSVLRPIFASPTCFGPKLHVIVLAERASGVQDVVTVPTSSCPPVRLRLDHGRFSKAE